jgi:hypothetical protein
MKISLEELMLRLNHPKNYLKGESPKNSQEIALEVHTLRQGRKEGQPNYDEETRVATGALARLIGPTAASEASGMTQGNASYLKRAYSSNMERHLELDEKIQERLNETLPNNGSGEIRTNGEFAPPKDLWTPRKQVEDRLSAARTSALETLISSIEGIHPAKLLDEKPKILASIAKDMASVLNSTNPHGNSNNLGIKVIINTVDRKDEDKYEVVEVSM